MPHTGGRLLLRDGGAGGDGFAVGIARTGIKHLCATPAHDAVDVLALDAAGRIVDVVPGRRVETSTHKTTFLYFPVVIGAAAYRVDDARSDVFMPAED